MRRPGPGLIVVLLALAIPGTAQAAADGGLRVIFTLEKAGQVAKAAQLGINEDLLYGSRAPKLETSLSSAGVRVIDGRLASELATWECHRTHTVVTPPPGWGPYCATDRNPSVNSPAVVLEAVEKYVRQDASDPLVNGYWVLDDWPPWDGGSARALLQEIHGMIERITPGYPAICGFGGSLGTPGEPERFESSAAENFSSSACSMVGLYNYAVWGKEPSNGAQLDWHMRVLLGEQFGALQSAGWNESDTPLLGIGQAFSGPFGADQFEQGLSQAQMVEQARAFCEAGATSLGWYAWDDSNFVHGSKTPRTSKVIRAGITQSAAACGLP